MRSTQRIGFALGLAAIVTVVGPGWAAAGQTAAPRNTRADVPQRARIVPSPPGDLYQPRNPLPTGTPGQLIWAERVKGLPLHPPSAIWRILYHSRSRDDHDVAVSGFAIVPTARAPRAGRPVYAWAHGTVGLGDQCAPSHQIRDNLPPYGGQQLERGAVLVATDYEGLGTPGIPAYSVGVSEGRGMLDAVRAVTALPNVGSIGEVVLAGHSQGGRAALFAAELAHGYAPELDLAGAVALAPGAELPTLVTSLLGSPYKAANLMGAIGLSTAYPALDLTTVLTSTTIADVPRIETECADATVARYQSLPETDVFVRDPTTIPAVEQILEENSPGATNPGVPIFIAQSDGDQQVPVIVSAQLEAKYCALGASVARHIYAGQDHDGVLDAANDDALAFITARFRDRAAASDCK